MSWCTQYIFSSKLKGVYDQVDPLRETLESLLDSTDMELETVDMAVEIDAKVCDFFVHCMDGNFNHGWNLHGCECDLR